MTPFWNDKAGTLLLRGSSKLVIPKMLLSGIHSFFLW